MPLQILTLKLDGITAGDYLTWCRDPDPPSLGHTLRALHVDADPLGDTITAILDWMRPPPPPRPPPAPRGCRCQRRRDTQRTADPCVAHKARFARCAPDLRRRR